MTNIINIMGGFPLDRRYIDEGNISNLPSYNFYARIAAVNAQEPMSGITVLLDNNGDEQVAKAVTEHSRQQYGAKKVIKETVEVVDEVPKQTRRRRRTTISKDEPSKPMLADKSRAL